MPFTSVAFLLSATLCPTDSNYLRNNVWQAMTENSHLPELGQLKIFVDLLPVHHIPPGCNVLRGDSSHQLDCEKSCMMSSKPQPIADISMVLTMAQLTVKAD